MSQDKTSPRLDPRVVARLRVTAFGALAGRSEIEMTTVNLSAGGAFCESPVAPPLGQSLKLRIDLTDEGGAIHPVVAEALVVRIEGAGPFVVALHFVNTPERVRDLLKRFVLRLLPAVRR